MEIAKPLELYLFVNAVLTLFNFVILWYIGFQLDKKLKNQNGKQRKRQIRQKK